MNFAQILVAVVLTSDGGIDGEATLAAAEVAVQKTKEEAKELAEAIRLQFSAHMVEAENGAFKAEVQPVEFFINGVVTRMHATPKTSGRLTKLVEEFVEANKEGNCENPMWRIKRGKGGGIERI